MTYDKDEQRAEKIRKAADKVKHLIDKVGTLSNAEKELVRNKVYEVLASELKDKD